MGRGFYTPWGSADTDGITLFAEGFVSVCTPSGGGYVFSERFANSNLSNPAKARAIRYGRSLCYDDKVLWAIPAYELKEWWPKLFKFKPPGFLPERDLLVHISRWCADYLLERRIKPEPKAYLIWQWATSEERMRKAKSPDLIVLAHDVGDGLVLVTTADGKEHRVSEKSFDDVAKSLRVFLLSDCSELKPRKRK